MDDKVECRPDRLQARAGNIQLSAIGPTTMTDGRTVARLTDAAFALTDFTV
jgi:hypothetical protein